MCLFYFAGLFYFVYNRVENFSNIILFYLKIQVKYRISLIDF